MEKLEKNRVRKIRSNAELEKNIGSRNGGNGDAPGSTRPRTRGSGARMRKPVRSVVRPATPTTRSRSARPRARSRVVLKPSALAVARGTRPPETRTALLYPLSTLVLSSTLANTGGAG